MALEVEVREYDEDEINDLDLTPTGFGSLSPVGVLSPIMPLSPTSILYRPGTSPRPDLEI